MPEWNDILHMITAAADWFQRHWTAVVAALALLGIGIDKTPWIKINPVKSFFEKLGTYIGDYLNKVFNANESMKRLESKIDEQAIKIEQVESEMRKNDNETAKDKVSRLRWEILAFANAQDFMDYDMEMYGHIMDVYEDYESTLRERGMPNGRVDAAYAKICRRREEKFGY